MRLSLVFELLLIFVLLAFAASATNVRRRPVLRQQSTAAPVEISTTEAPKPTSAAPKPTAATARPTKPPSSATQSRYCACSATLCNCCREFRVAALRGPGCASVRYMSGDRLEVSLSFADRVITSAVLSDRRAKAVCMPLPGGFSKFCGRIYNIARKNDNFGACLGLELRAPADIEASVRVSCFRFGPEGMKLEPAQPLPTLPADDEDDEDDDDDDDEFGLEYDEGEAAAFGLLGDDLFDGFDDDDDDDDDSPPVKPQPVIPPPKPVRRRPSTIKKPTPNRKPLRKVTSPTTKKPTPSIKPSTEPPTEPTTTTTTPMPVETIQPIASSTRLFTMLTDASTPVSSEEVSEMVTSTPVEEDPAQNEVEVDVSTVMTTPERNLVLVSSSSGMTSMPEDVMDTTTIQS